MRAVAADFSRPLHRCTVCPDYFFNTVAIIHRDFQRWVWRATQASKRMLYYVVKVLISALVIVAITEISKRSSGLAALLAALPLTSLLAFVWLHVDGAASAQIAALSQQIFWLVLPSLMLFLLLPMLLRHGLDFWLSLGLSVVATIGCYLILLPILRRLGVPL